MRHPPEKLLTELLSSLLAKPRPCSSLAARASALKPSIVSMRSYKSVHGARVLVSFAFGNARLQFPELLVAVHDVVEGRAAAVRTLLRDMSDLVVGTQAELTVVGFEFAKQHREQRRLAAAIGTDKTQTLPGVHLQAGFADK